MIKNYDSEKNPEKKQMSNILALHKHQLITITNTLKMSFVMIILVLGRAVSASLLLMI